MWQWLLVLVAACGAGVRAPRSVGPAVATNGPYELVASPPDGHWLVVCQARRDTNHNGRIDVWWEIHGEAGGDAMDAFLIDERGRETALDNVLAVDPTGRYLAVVEHGASVLIDTTTWHREPLDGEPPGFSIVRGVRRWAFDRSGARLLRFRGDTPVVRELATGSERTAPPAWRATWSTDGNWLELETLAGDTNHDGFVHGPDLSPSEGVPGQECARRFDWRPALAELDPTDAQVPAALASIDQPDDLASSLWRVGDGLVVPADTALDHDTVAAHRDGVLRIGKVGAPLAIAGDARCEIAAAYAPARTALLTCPTSKGHARVEWLRGGTRTVVEPDIPDDHPLVEGDQTGYAGVYPAQLIVDMRTGATVASGRELFYAWSDDDHVLIQHNDDEATLRWRSGRTIDLLSTAERSVHVAGRYLARGSQRVDLVTGEVVTLPSLAIAVRRDGAVLVDGGEQRLGETSARGPRVGPLHWIIP